MRSQARVAGMVVIASLALSASAQPQSPPIFATTKVSGTENVYIFRYVRHQSIFIVTPAGVIATDPIGLRRPAAKAYIEEIWDRLIPGHPGPDGRQIGTKEDARAALAYLQDLSAAVKQAADDHKCLDQAMREIKLPKYEKWANYAQYLPMNIERFCDFYSLGI